MPAGVKPPKTFCGKKGRSGRKSIPVERAKRETINKSWNILNNHLGEMDNINVALPIALKDMGKDDAKGQPTVIINVDGVLNKKYESPSESADNRGGQPPIQSN